MVFAVLGCCAGVSGSWGFTVVVWLGTIGGAGLGSIAFECGESSADGCRGRIGVVRAAQQQAADKPNFIAVTAGNDVQVHVPNGLECRCPVVEYKVCAVGGRLATPDRSGQPMTDPEEVRAGFGVQFGEVGCVLFRDNQRVASGHRSDIEESVCGFVFVHRRSRGSALRNPTKNAVVHSGDITVCSRSVTGISGQRLGHAGWGCCDADLS